MSPGIMPTLALAPGDIMPGQLGPISVTALSRMYRFTLMVSITGMPSVMQAMVGMPAATDSAMASAAKGGGTNMREQLALVFSTASSTVSNTGMSPSKLWPPRPGVTPATRLVPYSRQRWA